MKIVKSKLSIAILGIGFASVIGAVSYATIYRPAAFDSKPVVNKPVLVKNDAPKAPHQDEVQDYLQEMKSYLQTPPRDGVFGSDRIPTLHGKESEEIPAYEAIRALEGKVNIRSAVLGLEPAEEMKRMADISLADGVKPHNEPTDHIRLSDVHYQTSNQEESEQASKRWDNETDALRKFAVETRKKGVDQNVQKVSINGKENWIIAQAVHASVNSCYKCHTNVKKGEAIGYVTAIISEGK